MSATELDAASVEAWQTFELPTPVEHLRDWLVEAASIPGLLVAQAAIDPRKVALHIADASLRYDELVDRCASAAAELVSRGIDTADRVVIVGDNSVHLIVACLAVMWVGGVEVVANPGLTGRELGHIIRDSAATAVLADPEHLSRIANEDLPRAAIALGPELSSKRARAAEPVIGPHDVASLQYTSGTTGAPKGAVLTHANLVAYLRAVQIAWGWSADDVLMHSLPLAHGHGRNGVYTALLSGATARVLPRTNADAILNAFVDARPNVFYAVPAIWDRLLRAGAVHPSSFQHLRLYTSGSAPLDPGLAKRISDVLGAVPLERYGATETGIVVTNPLRGVRVPGSAGYAAPGAEVRVINGDGDPVSDGEVGEISVRGPSVFRGYWRQDSAGALEDGWYRTGDLGRFAAVSGAGLERRLFIVGRSRELIISGGLNVYPREVELVAQEHPAVLEAAVFGITSEHWGEEVVMLAVPRAGASIESDELIGFLRDRLAGYKTPKRVRVVSELPRNSLGKVARAKLSTAWPRT